MTNTQAIIDIEINTSSAAAQLRALQAQINAFQSALNKGNILQGAAAKEYAKTLSTMVNSSGYFTAEARNMRTAAGALDDKLRKGKGTFGDYFNSLRKGTSAFNAVQSLATARASALQTQFVATGAAANGFQQALAIKPMTAFNSQASIMAQKLAIQRAMFNQATTSMINFGKNVQWAGRQLMVGFTMPLVLLGAIAGKTFADLEKQVVSFKKVYGDMFTAPGELEANISAIRQLGEELTKYGIKVSDTMKLASEAAAAGNKNADLINMTTQATRLAVLGQLDQQKALETTIALQNAFGISNEDLAESIDFLNVVENQTVLTLQDMTDAIPRVAPVIKGLGGDVKDMAVMLAAMKEGGVSAAQGANALKSGLASLINPTNKAVEGLADMGINLNSIINANQGDLMGTVRAFGQAIGKLDEFSRQQAIEKVFGKYQYARLSALFNNITKEGTQAARAMEMMGMSAEELGQIADKELSAVAENPTVKLTQAIEKLKLAIVPLGEMFVKVATPIAEIFTRIFQNMDRLPDFVKKIGAIGTILIGLVIPAGTMFLGLLMNLMGTLLKFGNTFNVAFQGLISGGPRGAIKALSEMFRYLSLQEIEASLAAEQLAKAGVHVDAALREQALSAQSTRVAIDTLSAAYARLAVMMREAAMVSGGLGIPGAAMGRAAGAAARSGAVKLNKGGNVPYLSGGGSPSQVPGTGNTDTVPAMLTPGEFVVNKKATAENLPLLHAINNGQAQGLNKGGGVARLGRKFYGFLGFGRVSAAERAAQERAVADDVIQIKARQEAESAKLLQRMAADQEDAQKLFGSNLLRETSASRATKNAASTQEGILAQNAHFGSPRLTVSQAKELSLITSSQKERLALELVTAQIPVTALTDDWVTVSRRLNIAANRSPQELMTVEKALQELESLHKSSIIKVGPAMERISVQELDFYKGVAKNLSKNYNQDEIFTDKIFTESRNAYLKEIGKKVSPRITAARIPTLTDLQEYFGGLRGIPPEQAAKLISTREIQAGLSSRGFNLIAGEGKTQIASKSSGLSENIGASGKYDRVTGKKIGGWPTSLTLAAGGMIPGVQYAWFGRRITKGSKTATVAATPGGFRPDGTKASSAPTPSIRAIGTAYSEQFGTELQEVLRSIPGWNKIPKKVKRQMLTGDVAHKVPRFFGRGRTEQKAWYMPELFGAAGAENKALEYLIGKERLLGRKIFQEANAGLTGIEKFYFNRIMSGIHPTSKKELETMSLMMKNVRQYVDRPTRGLPKEQAKNIKDFKNLSVYKNKWFDALDRIVDTRIQGGLGGTRNVAITNKKVVPRRFGGIIPGVQYRTDGGDVYDSTKTSNPMVPGMGNTDTVPAMLTPGEFVVNKSATSSNLPLLRAINGGVASNVTIGGVRYLNGGGQATVVAIDDDWGGKKYQVIDADGNVRSTHRDRSSANKAAGRINSRIAAAGRAISNSPRVQSIINPGADPERTLSGTQADRERKEKQKADKKQAKEEKAAAKNAKDAAKGPKGMGRMALGGGLMMAAMLPMMMGDPETGKFAGMDTGMLTTGLMSAGMLLSLPAKIAAPLAAVAAPLALFSFGIKNVRESLDEATKASFKMGKNLGGAGDRMESVSQATGYLFASQRNRNKMFDFKPEDFKRMSEFSGYFESERGQAYIKDLQQLTNTERYAKVSSEIAFAIADGMDPKKAQAYGEAIAMYAGDAILKQRIVADFKLNKYKDDPTAIVDLVEKRVIESDKAIAKSRATYREDKGEGFLGANKLARERFGQTGMNAQFGGIATAGLIAGGATALTVAIIGATVGSAVPVIGTAIGFAVGAIIGGGIAWFANQESRLQIEKNTKHVGLIVSTSMQTLKEIGNAEEVLLEKRRKGLITEEEILKQQAKLDEWRNKAAENVKFAIDALSANQADPEAVKGQISGSLVLGGFGGDMAGAIANLLDFDVLSQQMFNMTYEELQKPEHKDLQTVLDVFMTDVMGSLTPENAAQMLPALMQKWSAMSADIVNGVYSAATPTSEMIRDASAKGLGEAAQAAFTATLPEGAIIDPNEVSMQDRLDFINNANYWQGKQKKTQINGSSGEVFVEYLDDKDKLRLSGKTAKVAKSLLLGKLERSTYFRETMGGMNTDSATEGFEGWRKGLLSENAGEQSAAIKDIFGLLGEANKLPGGSEGGWSALLGEISSQFGPSQISQLKEQMMGYTDIQWAEIFGISPNDTEGIKALRQEADVVLTFAEKEGIALDRISTEASRVNERFEQLGRSTIFQDHLTELGLSIDNVSVALAQITDSGVMEKLNHGFKELTALEVQFNFAEIVAGLPEGIDLTILLANDLARGLEEPQSAIAMINQQIEKMNDSIKKIDNKKIKTFAKTLDPKLFINLTNALKLAPGFASQFFDQTVSAAEAIQELDKKQGKNKKFLTQGGKLRIDRVTTDLVANVLLSYGGDASNADDITSKIKDEFKGLVLSPTILPIMTMLYGQGISIEELAAGAQGETTYTKYVPDPTTRYVDPETGQVTTGYKKVEFDVGPAAQLLGNFNGSITPTGRGQDDGSGGGGKENPLKTLQNTLIDQIKMYADITANVKKLMDKKYGLLKLLQMQNGVDDKIREAGFSPELTDYLMNLAPEDAMKIVKKYTIQKGKNKGQANEQGKIVSRAMEGVSIAGYVSDKQIENERAISGVFNQGRAIKMLQEMKDLPKNIGSAAIGIIGTDPEAARALIALRKSEKKAYEDYKKASKEDPGSKAAEKLQEIWKKAKERVMSYINGLVEVQRKTEAVTTATDALTKKDKLLSSRAMLAEASSLGITDEKTVSAITGGDYAFIYQEASTAQKRIAELEEKAAQASNEKERKRIRSRIDKIKKEYSYLGPWLKDFWGTLQETLATDKALENLGKPEELVYAEEWQKNFDLVAADFEKTFQEMDRDSDKGFTQAYGKSKQDAEILIQKNDVLLSQAREEVAAYERKNELEEMSIRQHERDKKYWQDLIGNAEDFIASEEKRIDDLQHQADLRTHTADLYNHDLDIIGKAEEQINEAYDKRVKALDQVRSLNDNIIQQQQNQLNLAKALSEGDVYAAASAAQQMQGQQVNYAGEMVSAGLEKGKENAIGGLTSASGMTRVQIQEQLWQIEQQNWQTEQDIYTIQQGIYTKQQEIYGWKLEIDKIDKSIKEHTDVIFYNEGEILRIQNEKIIPLTQESGLWQGRLDTSAASLAVSKAEFKIGGLTLQQHERMNTELNSQAKYMELLQKQGISLYETWKGIAQQAENARLAAANDLAKIQRGDMKLSTINAEEYKNPDGSYDIEGMQDAINKETEGFINDLITAAKNSFNASGAVAVTAAGNGMGGMATGGLVGMRRVGASGRDSVPMMLTPGEFVVRKSMVDKYGSSMFENINMGSFSVPRYRMPGSTPVTVRNSESNIHAPVYNTYSVNVPVTQPNASAEDIANKVITKIRSIESSSIRSINGY